MIKRSIIIAALLLWCNGVIAQNDPSIVRVVTITPKPGMNTDLEKGLKDHNDKFHKRAGYEVYTWQIISGDDYGSYLRATGRKNWKDFDNEDDPPEDAEHWNKYVTPYVEESTGQEYWKRYSNLSYNGLADNSSSEMSNVTFFSIRDGYASEFLELQAQAKEANENTKRKSRYSFYRRVNGGDMMEMGTVTAVNSWADMESTGMTFGDRINKVHGKNAWDKWIATFQKVVEKRETQMRIYRPDLSIGN
ncbi:MAG: hypothetical protein V1257_08780 [Candidatus Neomarinimicrobiota bacterium]|jgi:hypothetical protein|nr:hypothetical protein [Candidatus Neomarinimicrobiota bacterium]HJN67821.1 hypothetical protein [Candidatus Neomarinimicrobiota bacterium]|tara:strand:+ start:596 stop:1339 length:744 start_codon:yes stop_codon:yes gene_type:complete